MTENLNNTDKSNLSGSDYLAELIKSVSEGSQSEPQAADAQPSVAANGKGAGADLLSSLLSNPDLIAKLPTIIATVKPIIELLGSTSLAGNGSPSMAVNSGASVGGMGAIPTAAQAPSVNVQSAFAQIPSAEEKTIPTSVSHSGRRGGDRRAELLCALKPYLCEERRQAIDYVIKLDRLGDVLKSL